MIGNSYLGLCILFVSTFFMMVMLNPADAQNNTGSNLQNNSSNLVVLNNFNKSGMLDSEHSSTLAHPASERLGNVSFGLPNTVTPQEQINRIAKLVVVTQIEPKCSINGSSPCLPFEEHDVNYLVRALQPDNSIAVIAGPNEGRSIGWILPLFIKDSEMGLQYNVRPESSIPKDINFTMSSGCEGILMGGENKTCNLLYKSWPISQ